MRGRWRGKERNEVLMREIEKECIYERDKSTYVIESNRVVT